MQTNDGHTYKGMFYTIDMLESHIVLSHVKRDDGKDTHPYSIIPFSLFDVLTAEEVDLSGQDIAAKPFSTVVGFEDTANGRENGGCA